MAVLVPRHFDALAALRSEGLPIAVHKSQPARRIGLLNLMPDKKATERQFARLFSRIGFDTALIPLRMATHQPTHCERTYLDRVYHSVSPQLLDSLDALVVTGAPVERLPFDNVDYWTEFTEMLDHLAQRRVDTLFLCWSAQAALFHGHGVDKHTLDNKAFGVFPQWVFNPASPLSKDLGHCFPTPVSRHSSIHTSDVLAQTNLQLIAGSDATGPALVTDPSARQTFMFNHLEYETTTLHEEYMRDRRINRKTDSPRNYYRDGYPANSWSAHGHLFFRNWMFQLASTRGDPVEASNAIGIAA